MASLPETLHVRVKQKMAGVYMYEGRDPWLRCIFLVSSPAMLSQIRGHSFTFLLNCRFYRSLETIQRSLLSVYFPANKKTWSFPCSPRCDTKIPFRHEKGRARFDRESHGRDLLILISKQFPIVLSCGGETFAELELVKSTRTRLFTFWKLNFFVYSFLDSTKAISWSVILKLYEFTTWARTISKEYTEFLYVSYNESAMNW